MDLEASYYDKTEDGGTVCVLCPRKCALRPGGTGACLARGNREGVLYSLNYGKITSMALDPIEKKPLKNFHPGSYILSAGSFGCNFNCPFCQNYQISKNIPDTYNVSPASLVQNALSARSDGNIGIAFTYNEPLVGFEFVRDTARLAASANLISVLVTNGYVEPEPLRELLPAIGAMNVDLKGSESFYWEMCGGNRKTVVNTIKAAYESGCHVEVTNLIVSGKNDTRSDVEDVAATVAEISRDIPLHLSRFFPRYKMRDLSPTSAAFMYKAAEYAGAYLERVYIGNV